MSMRWWTILAGSSSLSGIWLLRRFTVHSSVYDDVFEGVLGVDDSIGPLIRMQIGSAEQLHDVSSSLQFTLHSNASSPVRKGHDQCQSVMQLNREYSIDQSVNSVQYCPSVRVGDGQRRDEDNTIDLTESEITVFEDTGQALESEESGLAESQVVKIQDFECSEPSLQQNVSQTSNGQRY